MLMVGGVVSTRKVALGPAAGARFPAVSEAVLAAMEIFRVPVPEPPPEIAEMVTVRVLPVPVTLTVPLAVPVGVRVIFAGTKVLDAKLASEYVTV